MEGISKDELIQLQSSIFARDNEDCTHAKLRMIQVLIDQCHELQEPWIPIDKNTPRDRQIKIYDVGYGQVVVQWNAYFRCFTDPRGGKYLNPSHYQELPEPPK